MSAHREEVQKACDLLGGQRALARKLSEETERKITQAHVWGWLNEAKKFPAEICAPLERITGGQVRKYKLRPDLFEESEAA